MINLELTELELKALIWAAGQDKEYVAPDKELVEPLWTARLKMWKALDGHNRDY
jgi:hypothetical protein